MGFWNRKIKAPSNEEKIPKSWLTRKYEQVSKDYKEDRAAARITREQVREARYIARRDQAVREAKEQERIRANARLKSFKAKQNRPAFDFGGFAGPTQKGPRANIGIGEALLEPSPNKSRNYAKDPVVGDLFGSGGGVNNPMLGDLFGSGGVRPKPKRRKSKTITIKM